MPKYRSALIVGTGPGLSASLARLFAKNGLSVALAARQTEKLAALAKETGASVHACNAADQKDVAALFEALDAAGRTPDVVVYNASNRVRGALVDLAPDDVKRAIDISAFGAFLVSQQAVKRMLPKGEGAVLLSGATAGVKGFALSATFAMGKFALRGLAQSMARELSPKGIHVAHPVIDGAIDTEFIRTQFPERYALKEQQGIVNPEHIADLYWQIHQQPRDAWIHETELRPWLETW